MAELPLQVGPLDPVSKSHGISNALMHNPQPAHFMPAQPGNPQFIFLPSSAIHNRSSHHNEPLPSSEPDDIEDPTLFPRITTWLQELENSKLRHDGYDFPQYAVYFEDAKFFRTSQIADSSPQQIAAICPGMPSGTAGQIYKVASVTVKKIRKGYKAERAQRRSLDVYPQRYF